MLSYKNKGGLPYYTSILIIATGMTMAYLSSNRIKREDDHDPPPASAEPKAHENDPHLPNNTKLLVPELTED